MPHVTVAPKTLASALSALRPAVSRRSAIEALRGVRITANENAVRLSVSDLTIFGELQLADAAAQGDVDVVVDHALLADVARLLAADGELTLSVECSAAAADPGRVRCRCARRSVTLPLYRLADFPAWPTGAGERVLTANGTTLGAALERVGRFASKDETRPVLCTLNLDWEQQPVLVATDTWRLAVIAAPARVVARKRRPTRQQPNPNQLTIDARGLLVAAKAMRGAETIELLASQDFATVQWPSARFTIRRIPGHFPRWRELITDNYRTWITLSVAELAQACELANAFVTDGKAVELHADGDVRLQLDRVSDAGFEQALAEAQIERSEPGAVEVHLNPQFLRSAAKAIMGERVAVKLSSNRRRPVLFEDGDDRYLVMPMVNPR